MGQIKDFGRSRGSGGGGRRTWQERRNEHASHIWSKHYTEFNQLWDKWTNSLFSTES